MPMHKSKEKSEKVVIISGSKESDSSIGKTKILHPPIEANWSFPQEEVKKKKSLMSMTLNPLKFRNSLKRIGRTKHLKMIIRGPHDPKSEELVEQFRDMLVIEGVLPEKQNDYHTLLRFLRMRDFDMIKAKEMFLKYIKWREDFGVDAIPKEFKFDEYGEVKKCYPHGFHGVDKYGRPIYIERIGMVDLHAFLQVTTVEKFVKYHVSEQEKTLKLRYPACSVAATRHVASTTSIIDVQGVGLSNFSKPARELFTEIQKIDSNYYPETLNRLVIVNAGSGFRVLWKALRTFLDQRTLSKIQVLGSNYRSNLAEIIDTSNLPSFLGGNCTCPEYGGCLLSDKGPWNDPEIMPLLQAFFDAEVNGFEELSGMASEEDSDNRLIIESSEKEKAAELEQQTKTQNVKKLVPQKFQAFDAALKDTKIKIQALESALEDTKMVLRGLEQHIRGLRS